MQWFLTGLGYGLMAFGWLMAFGGCVVVFVSLCSFVSWIGGKVDPDSEKICEEDGEDE